MPTGAIESLQASIEHLSQLLIARLEADPFRTFLALVAVFLAAIVGSSWLMITWLSSGEVREGNANAVKVERSGKQGGKKE